MLHFFLQTRHRDLSSLALLAVSQHNSVSNIHIQITFDLKNAWFVRHSNVSAPLGLITWNCSGNYDLSLICLQQSGIRARPINQRNMVIIALLVVIIKSGSFIWICGMSTMYKFLLAPMGVLLPVSADTQHSAQPPIAPVKNCQRMCLQKHL